MEDEITLFHQSKAFLEKYIDSSKYIIIKLGTRLLTPILGSNEGTFFKSFAQEIQKIKKRNKNIVIVSSGAVGLGTCLIPTNKKMISLVERQALAALGQGLLINLYRDHFSNINLLTAQILVSNTDFKNRGHYRNLKNTIDQLFRWDAIPIVNENDTVATDELKFGDNDSLASAMAGMYPQSLLILLSSVDGFYIHEKRKLLLQKITSTEMKHAGKASSGGIGGMKTKILAAKNIIRSGQIMNIASGKDPLVLSKIMSAQETGTWFFNDSDQTLLNSKKRWLLNNPFSFGFIVIDSGAEQAIRRSASLLMVGVERVEGEFSSGDIVFIKNTNLETIAKGIASVGSRELTEARNKTGIGVVHQDNLVLV